MPPRRDVEREVYAQLYGEPPETSDGEPTRVIGDRVRELRPPEEPEPPQPPPPRLSKLDDALSWAAAQARVLKATVRSGRARVAPRSAPASRGRPLAAGAIAAALLALGVVGAFSGGSRGAPEPRATASAAPSPSGESRRAAANEAREARRRQLSRRRRAARRRAAERAEARRAEADQVQAQAPPRGTAMRCAEGQECVGEGTVVRRTQSNGDGDEGRSSARQEVDEPSGDDGDDFEVDTSDADDAENINIDVDVDEPEID